MPTLKPVAFLGNALEELRSFPIAARREAGFQIHQLQHGLEPDNWKPLSTIGPGVREIRISEANGIFRIMYIAKFADVIYILHCFQKKSQKTSKTDLELATKRYRELRETKP